MASPSTPRRPPPLTIAASTITTPVRESLRKLTGDHDILDNTKRFIDDESRPRYSSLDVQLVKAEVEANKLKRFLTVTRKVKYYNPKIGPYDSVKLVVKEDGTFCLLACDTTIEEGRVEGPLASSHIVPLLDKMADPHIAICSGIQDYSVYKASIGFEMSRVALVSCPPDSVRDIECTVLYENKSTRRRSLICPKCNSLKWQLSRRKREHDKLTPSQRIKRQSSSSHVLFDVLSPCSKKARFKNMRETIHHLQSKVVYFSERVNRLSISDKQNSEIGQLISSICTSPHGTDSLHEIFAEADKVQHGLGETVKEIWEKDVNDWNQFVEDQENNGSQKYRILWSHLIIFVSALQLLEENQTSGLQ